MAFAVTLPSLSTEATVLSEVLYFTAVFVAFCGATTTFPEIFAVLPFCKVISVFFSETPVTLTARSSALILYAGSKPGFKFSSSTETCFT